MDVPLFHLGLLYQDAFQISKRPWANVTTDPQTTIGASTCVTARRERRAIHSTNHPTLAHFAPRRSVSFLLLCNRRMHHCNCRAIESCYGRSGGLDATASLPLTACCGYSRAGWPRRAQTHDRTTAAIILTRGWNASCPASPKRKGGQPDRVF
jgi:hypothetical protein